MALTLRLQVGDDDPETVELDGPGGEIRFGVGAPGSALSGVWRVWSNKNKGAVSTGQRNSSSSLREGGTKPRVWRGRPLSLAATASRCS